LTTIIYIDKIEKIEKPLKYTGTFKKLEKHSNPDCNDPEEMESRRHFLGLRWNTGRFYRSLP
jgi:hypothetical protein